MRMLFIFLKCCLMSAIAVMFMLVLVINQNYYFISC